MNQTVTSFTPGSRPLSQNLGFDAAAVIVDNFTSSYVTLPDAGKTIPPWVYGAVVALPPAGIRWANATLTPTVPAVPGPPVPVSQAVLTWTDQPLPADPGHLLQQSSYANQVLVANVQASAGATVTKTSLAVPAGTQSIGCLVRSDASGGGFFDTPQNVTITGTQTRNEYTNTTPPNNLGGVNWYPFSSTDTAVDVKLQAAALDPSSIDVLASPLALAVDITNPFGNLLDVVITDPGTGTALPIVGSGGTSAAVPVSEQNSNPAPWQAAATSVPVRVAPGLNTDFTIKAGVVGKAIWLHDTVTNTNAGASWEVDFWDGPSANGVKVADLFIAVITGVGVSPPVRWDGRGRVLGGGDALVGTLATGPAGSTIFGTVGLTQQ